MPVGGPDLPDGEAEGGVLGLRQYGPRRAQQALVRGPQAVEKQGGGDFAEHPRSADRDYAGGDDERRLGDALGGQTHGPDGYARPVGDPHERRARKAEAVEDVLHPEGVAVALGRGPLLRALARLANDVGRVEAVSLRQRQKPLEDDGVQEVAAREEHRGRGICGPQREDVGVAEARLHGQALVAETQSGERLFVERPDLSLSLGRLVDGFRRRAPPTRKAGTPRKCCRPPQPRPSSAAREPSMVPVATRDSLFRQRRSRYGSRTSWLGLGVELLLGFAP